MTATLSENASYKRAKATMKILRGKHVQEM